MYDVWDEQAVTVRDMKVAAWPVCFCGLYPCVCHARIEEALFAMPGALPDLESRRFQNHQTHAVIELLRI
jgi:hypothetical protein